MIFILKHKRMLLGGALVLAIFVGSFLLWSNGYQEAEEDITAKENVAVIQAVSERESLEDEVIKLPVTDLLRRYCRWVRDDKDKCLQANLPIR